MNYMRSNDKRFHTFVANRVAIIHDGSSPSQWRYVNTEANPADDASRGLAVDSLIKKNRWIRGPNFLWEQESRWPAQPTTVREIPDEVHFPLFRMLEQIARTSCLRNSHHGLDSRRLWPGSCAIETD